MDSFEVRGSRFDAAEVLVPAPAPAGVFTRDGHNRLPVRTSSQCICPQAEVPALIRKIVVLRPVIMPAQTPHSSCDNHATLWREHDLAPQTCHCNRGGNTIQVAMTMISEGGQTGTVAGSARNCARFNSRCDGYGFAPFAWTSCRDVHCKMTKALLDCTRRQLEACQIIRYQDLLIRFSA